MHDAARRRLALGVLERVFQVHVVIHAPAEVLVEGLGIFEHVAHIIYLVDLPAAKVLVEDRGVLEHPAKILDLVYYPAADRPIEGRGFSEHISHVRDFRCVPITYVFVKRRRGRMA